MTKGFKRTRTGRITARFDQTERDVLTMLATQLFEIVQPPTAKHADPLAVELGLEDLDTAVDVAAMGMLEQRDPVVDRLFPAAYEDEAAAMEFRRFTELGLRQQKAANVQVMLDTLAESGDKVTLSAAQALAWLAAFNDLRLALAVRLGIETEADHERIDLLDDEEVVATYNLYQVLTFLQDTLVQALDR